MTDCNTCTAKNECLFRKEFGVFCIEYDTCSYYIEADP